MDRFRDILDGYLKIKKAPKNYYNADERLAKAKAAMEDLIWLSMKRFEN